MTTTIKNVEILATLDEDPHVSFFPWEMEVQDIAASMAKSLHPQGLLSDILTDVQWAAYPGNSTLDANGQTQIAARFQLPVYVDIVNTMTNVELYVAKAGNDRLQLWIDSTETLKRAVIKSLGRVVRQMVKDKKVRFQTMSVSTILARVRARYGKMQRDTKLSLRDRMLTLMPTLDGLDTHISNLQDMFDVSEIAGSIINEDRKVEMFRETVCAHPLITKLLETFDMDFPDAQLVTYEQIAAYLVVHLPNLKHSQTTATRATANLLTATAYSTLEAETQRLKAENDKLKRKRPNQTKQPLKNQKGKGKGKGRGSRKGKRDAESSSTETLKYCYGHGSQRSHTSAECKMLAGDKAQFNAAMRAATGPNNPPGGSTKVNGQEVSTTKTKKVSAHVAYDEDDADDNGEYDADDNDAYDETATFLASCLSDSNSDDHNAYDTLQGSAMMIEDTLLFDESDPAPSTNEVTHADGERRLMQPPVLSSRPTQAIAAAQSARSPTSRQSYLQPKPVNLTLGESKVVGELETGGSKVADERETMEEDKTPAHVTLITDGSQFRKPFWEAEVQLLQDLIRRQYAGRKDILSRRIPTADELQIQFVTWLIDQPNLPLLSAPVSSGFYSAIYGICKPPPSSGTGFFDEEYVSGKCQRNMPTVSRDGLNPATRPDLTYQEACTAELTTPASVAHHEKRLYLPGYTPTSIRNNIRTMLQTADPDQHMVDFQEKDIPPQNRDPQTHRILTDLLQKRNELDEDFLLDPNEVAADGTIIYDKGRTYEQEYVQRDREYNRINRGMYHVYAASAYIIHDRNFLSYCRPTLRNLPITTAYKLAKLKARLIDLDTTNPPYQTIQKPTRVQTQPIFSAPRPSYADVLRHTLQPRKDWMRDQPPYMSDSEADHTWHRSNAATFGSGNLTDAEIQQQIDILKSIQDQRLQTALPLPPRHDRNSPSKARDQQHPSTHNLESRIFRQGKKTNTADDNLEKTFNQSNSGDKSFSVEKAVNQQPKQNISEKRSRFDQSYSSSQSVFSSNAQPNLSSGRKKQNVRQRKDQFHHNDDSEGEDMTLDERDMWSKLVKASDKWKLRLSFNLRRHEDPWRKATMMRVMTRQRLGLLIQE